MLHSLGILLGPEDVDGVVWRAERFQAFITLHAVIEGRSHAVNAQKRVLDKGWGCPFAGLDRVM